MSAKKAETIIALTTSNASKKYFTDAMLVLSAPTGWVIHFRYELRWVDDALKNQLPLRDEVSGGSKLKNTRVLAAYVFQERDPTATNSWKQTALYPLRYGKLIDAYSTGKSPHDVAHFYFAVDQFYVPTDPGQVVKPEAIVSPGKYAGWTAGTGASSFAGESAASSLVEAIPPDHMTYQPDPTNLGNKTQYYPILCHMRGLRRRGSSRSAALKVEFGRAGSSSYYDLTERQEYLFDFSFYVPSRFSAPMTGSRIVLEYDDETFTSTARNVLPVESRYDETSWLVIPATAERQLVRELSFKTEIKVPATVKAEPADLSLTIPVAIHQSGWLRTRYGLADFLSDIGLSAGTIGLALVGTASATGNSNPLFGLSTDRWVLFVILGYVLWIVAKLLARIWKI